MSPTSQPDVPTTDERLQQLLTFGLTEQQARDQIRDEALLRLLETAETLDELRTAIRSMINAKA